MSSWQLGLDLIATFLLAAGLLFHYGNWYRHHLIVTLSVLVAWYFSFIIVFVLPLDISGTTYRQCLSLSNVTSTTLSTVTPSTIANFTSNTTTNSTKTSLCQPPSSYVGDEVLTNLWRVVYWSSQCLTWLILPIMQSYTQAGEFNVKGKIKSALLDNVMYYSLYLFICSILLIYLATRPDLSLDWSKLKAIASSASNSWGLFLLVFMLGYGLVSVPQTLWSRSCKGYSLNNSYFKMAKISQERNSAEEQLDDVLETLQTLLLKSQTTSSVSSLSQQMLSTIECQIPLEFRERMRRRRVQETTPIMTDEKTLTKLHKQVKKVLQNYHRVERQWEEQISTTVGMEDVERNLKSSDRIFKRSLGKQSPAPKLEWYIRCIFHRWILKLAAILAAFMSLSVIWSEATFFNKSPVLSIFAGFLNIAKENYDYVSIEAVATITTAYLACCAFYTVFKIRIFNFYYLATNHQTDEYSLIFSGMFLCRLTPPLCLNVISVFQLDSHVILKQEEETSYTKIMGHMDVLSLISDGFNIYFPMGILLISLLTYFKVGLRLLSIIGFQQFLHYEEDEMTSELVTEGQILTQREKRRRLLASSSSPSGGGSGVGSSSIGTRNRSGGPADGGGGGVSIRSNNKYRTTAAQQANQNVENLRSLQEEEYYYDGAAEDNVLTRNYNNRYGTQQPLSSQPPRDLFDDV